MSFFSSHWRLVVTAGFAMFSMFFGSGNLVYPLIAGSASSGNYVYTTAGFILTAVCVPFLGLLGMILHEGDRDSFFAGLGKYLQFILIFLILALMGPFAVIPRCINVAYGGISAMTSLVNPVVFSLIFCLLTIALIWRRNRVVDIIAFFLTPFKFGSIVLLIVCGLWFHKESLLQNHNGNLEAFGLGLLEGYQTLDLMAGFFFACTIYEYLRLKLNQQSNVQLLFRLSMWSSLLGGGLLAVVYVGFIALGTQYAGLIKDVDPALMLSIIAKYALGSYGLPIVSLTLVASCVATATVLSNLFVEFLQKDIFNNKISRFQSIAITMIITFVVSLFGFQSIRVALASVLSWVYPLLIIYTVWQILVKCRSPKRVPKLQR